MTDPRPLVIYHSPCQDGFAAAVAAYSVLGDHAEYLGAAHGDGLADRVVQMSLGRRVYVLDFSFPKETMLELMAAADGLVWLDHHKTALEDWVGSWSPGLRFSATYKTPGEAKVVLDDGQSGAMLAWRHFGTGRVPVGVRHVDDRDRWKFELEGTREYCARLAMVPYDMQQWLDNLRAQEKMEWADAGGRQVQAQWRTTHVYDAWIETGRLLVRRQEMDVESAFGRATAALLPRESVPEGSHNGGMAANAPRSLASDLGHRLAVHTGTFGLVWYVDDRGMACCSLRSEGDYDVSAVARHFGGGGHRNAAGFEVRPRELLAWLVG